MYTRWKKQSTKHITRTVKKLSANQSKTTLAQFLAIICKNSKISLKMYVRQVQVIGRCSRKQQEAVSAPTSSVQGGPERFTH